jgi:hypothetical protein
MDTNDQTTPEELTANAHDHEHHDHEHHDHEHHDHEHHEIPRKKINAEQFLTMIRGMLIDEKITLRQARELRRQFGISNSYFTKKKVSVTKKKRKRAIAAMSRRKNRYNCSTKGHKRNNGHVISSAR